MKKSELLTLLFLSHRNLDHLETLSDFIDQFDEIEKQFQSLLDNRESKS